jgi:probable DNA metabolism protein
VNLKSTIFVYDGTFEGFLTLVFDVYEMKIEPEGIYTEHNFQQKMFFKSYHVITDESKAERVWNGLKKKASSFGYHTVYYVYLSENEGREILLYHYLKKVFAFKGRYEYNFSDEHVMQMEDIRKKVAREAQRMLMFVRFQKTTDGLFYSAIEPKYDVLSLVTKHFRERYADQKWVLYDMKRKYGFYFDTKEILRVAFDDDFAGSRSIWLPREVIHDEEIFFQQLWKEYFKVLSIKERKNLRLQMQHLPKRFWKYLPEKQ